MELQELPTLAVVEDLTEQILAQVAQAVQELLSFDTQRHR
jgi:hypothetical protein